MFVKRSRLKEYIKNTLRIFHPQFWQFLKNTWPLAKVHYSYKKSVYLIQKIRKLDLAIAREI